MKAGAAAPSILVTDAGRGSSIAIIRSLGRAGYRVIAADSNPKSLGFLSRHAHGRLVYPPPDQNPLGFVATLREALREHGVGLVIPVTDQTILPLAAARQEIEPSSRLAIPDPGALEVVNDKRRTLELAGRLGVPIPRTAVVETLDEAMRESRALGWPLVLKPQSSSRYRDRVAIDAYHVTYAEDAGALERQMQRFAGRCPVLLQEYCSGTGHGVELLAHRGRPLAAFQHRRLREVPVTGGASALRQSVRLDPVLYAHAARLLGALSWTGLAMVEFKLGREGPKLMEVNGRVWGSLPLAVHAGMDFPRQLARLHFDGPPGEGTPPDTNYRVGVRARNLELDLLWIAAVIGGRRRHPFLPTPGRLQGLRALVELLDPTCHSDAWAFDDLRPALSELPRVIAKLGRKLRTARESVSS